MHVSTKETLHQASLAQSVDRETLDLKLAGSTPAWGLATEFHLVKMFFGMHAGGRVCFCPPMGKNNH
jgi:hypothetical protein